MIETTALLAFAGASFALAASPGPDMMLCASRAASQGRAAGFATLAGVMVGLQLHATAAGLGLSQLLLATPAAFEAVRWAGAGYLLFLAAKALRAKGGGAATADAPAPPVSLAEAFRVGLLTNLLNPKVILFVLALYPQFLSPTGSIFAQMSILGLVNNVVAAPVNGVVILFAARVGRRLSSGEGRMAKIGRWLLATMFAGLAARLVVGGRG